MFDKILVAIGGDDASFEPARVAGRLASSLGAQLTLLSVRPPTRESLGEPFYSHALSEQLEVSEATLERAQRLAEDEGALVASVDSVEGPPAARIIEFARHGGFGLIVMGNRRRNRLQSALLGSVSAAVAAHSAVPVMIVPERATGVNDSGMGI